MSCLDANTRESIQKSVLSTNDLGSSIIYLLTLTRRLRLTAYTRGVWAYEGLRGSPLTNQGLLIHFVFSDSLGLFTGNICLFINITQNFHVEMKNILTK